MKVTIYWVTNSPQKKDEIRRYFNIPHYSSVNGETEFKITEDMLKVLRKGEPKFIQIRHIDNEE